MGAVTVTDTERAAIRAKILAAFEVTEDDLTAYEALHPGENVAREEADRYGDGWLRWAQTYRSGFEDGVSAALAALVEHKP